MKLIATILVLSIGGALSCGVSPVRDSSGTRMPVFSVREFGVAGDGVTLDTRAIQAAIDACAAVGGIVVVPHGTYLITLDLANSCGSPTVGLFFVGFQRKSIHSNWGGDLLVVPSLVTPIAFSYSGDSFTGDLPRDWTLCGFITDLQAIEADPGAAKGVSFTAGLELLLGR